MRQRNQAGNAVGPGVLPVRTGRRAPWPSNLMRWSTLDAVRAPFKGAAGVAGLLDYWKKGAGLGAVAGDTLRGYAEEVATRLPALAGSFDPGALPDDHREEIARLMTVVYPPVHGGMVAALAPFTYGVLWANADFRSHLLADDGAFSVRVYRDARMLSGVRTVALYAHLARTLYGLDVPVAESYVLAARDRETGLDRYYNATFDYRFLEPRAGGEVPPLSDDDRARLLAHAADPEVWQAILPPDAYRFEGFELLVATEVTEQQVLSLLKSDLIETESIASGGLFPLAVERVRTLLGNPRVAFGLAAVDGNRVYPLFKRTQIGADCLFVREPEQDLSAFADTVIDRAIQERTFHLVDDLAVGEAGAEIEADMVESGARAFAVSPLFDRGALVGLFYVWSPAPGDLQALDVMRLHRLVPLFTSVVRRSREELHHRVQSVILNEYTAIHPSVEWRFRRAALNYVRQQDQGRRAEVEPIVFEEVYPLYGVADIRGSSTHRNEAVQFDLLEHLAEVDDILRIAHREKPLPILEYLLARNDQYRASLEAGLTSDDEAGVKDFLQRNIDPLLDHLRQYGPAVSERVDEYLASVDPHTGRLYQRCRAFDESVAEMNRMLSAYIDAEERKAQLMFPHYFEKHETDGIEYSIFVGASLQEDGTFNPIYIKNLRLWQLLMMCRLARRAERLKATLPVPLEVTHLIISQSAPLSIRFQLDEMRFDVDGTHDIRYEIIKRRVEKANLKGRSERLTQPGKIAIVYSQAREAWEYDEYIRFLQIQGQIVGDAEEVELADLQGIRGLKALRLTVAVDHEEQPDELSAEVIDRVVQRLPQEMN